MSTRAVSILLDPKLHIDDVRMALSHSSIEVVGSEYHPTIFVLRPILAETPRVQQYD